MDEDGILSLILDNWNKPVVFVDSNHIIRYMNSPAKKHYKKWGNVIGKSIFDCHNKKSTNIIKDAFKKLEEGDEEALIVDNKKHRIYMRAVKDEKNFLIGYYERYELPNRK